MVLHRRCRFPQLQREALHWKGELTWQSWLRQAEAAAWSLWHFIRLKDYCMFILYLFWDAVSINQHGCAHLRWYLLMLAMRQMLVVAVWFEGFSATLAFHLADHVHRLVHPRPLEPITLVQGGSCSDYAFFKVACPFFWLGEATAAFLLVLTVIFEKGAVKAVALEWLIQMLELEESFFVIGDLLVHKLHVSPMLLCQPLPHWWFALALLFQHLDAIQQLLLLYLFPHLLLHQCCYLSLDGLDHRGQGIDVVSALVHYYKIMENQSRLDVEIKQVSTPFFTKNRY